MAKRSKRELAVRALRVLDKYEPEKLTPACLMVEVHAQAREIVEALVEVGDLVVREPFPKRLAKDPDLHQFYSINPKKRAAVDKAIGRR